MPNLSASLDVEYHFSGNVDARLLKSIAELYGFSILADKARTRDGVDLLTIKTTRNDLAHGDTVSYGSESLTVDTAHDLLTLSGGFNAPLDEGVLLFGDASVLNGLGNTGTTGYSVAGGLKAYW